MTLFLPYFPDIVWCSRFLFGPHAGIEQYEHFVKASARNRCHIGGANGKLILSVPLDGGRDHHRPYREVYPLYADNWQRRHWQSILSAYSSAPFFEHYAPDVKSLFEQKGLSLFDYNHLILVRLLKMLSAERQVIFTQQYQGKQAAAAKTDYAFLPRYYQIFESKNGFLPNLSIIDLLFHEGPAARAYLKEIYSLL